MTQQLTVWRRRLIQDDPERDWSYAWTTDFLPGSGVGSPIGQATIQSQKTQTNYDLETFWWRPRGDTEPFHFGFRLPRDKTTPPGNYNLTINTIPSGILQVFGPRPVHNPTHVKTSNELYLALVNKAKFIIMAPGWYRVNTPIIDLVAAGTTIVGYGARIDSPRIRENIPNQPSNNNIFHTFGEDVTIIGVTFAIGWNLSFHDARGLIFVDCEFLSNAWHTHSISNIYWDLGGGGVSIIGPENMLRNCRFNDSMLTISQGMVLDCQWNGRPPGKAHNFVCNNTDGPLAVIGINMHDTDRGLVVRPMTGNIENALFTDIICRNIRTEINGCELICAEGTFTIRRTIFNKLHSIGCLGEMRFTTALEGCHIHGCMLDGGGGMYFQSVDPSALQTGNRVWNCEIRGAGLYLGPTFQGNDLFYMGIFDPKPYTQNQFLCYPSKYQEVSSKLAGIVDKGGNPMIRDMYFHLPTGMPQVERAAVD